MATKTKAAASPPKADPKSVPGKDYPSAMDKLRDEMAMDGGRYVQVVGEYLTGYLIDHPEAEAAILDKDKTIQGSLKAMESEARKVKTGNVAVLDDATGFRIVREYFGIGAGADVTKTPQNVTKTPQNVTAAAGTSSVTAVAATPDARRLARAYGPPEGKAFGEADPFDLDTLLGVM